MWIEVRLDGDNASLAKTISRVLEVSWKLEGDLYGFAANSTEELARLDRFFRLMPYASIVSVDGTVLTELPQSHLVYTGPNFIRVQLRDDVNKDMQALLAQVYQTRLWHMQGADGQVWYIFTSPPSVLLKDYEGALEASPLIVYVETKQSPKFDPIRKINADELEDF